MERAEGDAHEDECGDGDVVARAFGGEDGLPHVIGGQPVEGDAREAAEQCGVGDEGKQAGGQPAADQKAEARAADGGLFGPGGDGGEQEGDDHAAGVAPNHFVGVPEEAGKLRGALVAEAPEEDGECAVKGGERIERAEGHRPDGVLEEFHDVVFSVLVGGLVVWKRLEAV